MMVGKSTARRVQRAFVRFLLFVAPRRNHVVVSGFPVTEGNAVEMLRVLVARYRGRVVWLVPDQESARRVLDTAGLDPHGRVQMVAHRSWAGMWAVAGAEVTMFTHGVYGNPGRVPRKVLVNLWHGGGIKSGLMIDDRGSPTITSDYLVASTQQIGKILARNCRLPDGGLLVTGNPRVDQFARVDATKLQRLGLSADDRFVLWMPTFRKNKGHGLTAGWSEVGDGAVDVNLAIADGVRVLKDAGITVVIKPHPQDAESRLISGAVVITNDDLVDAGLTLYELIGGSAGLLTDYSSVWIDYLGLDRPIGFVVPDVEEYAHGRGFDPPDALDWLPGPVLESAADYRAFAADVLAGGAASAARRREVVEHVGHVYTPDTALRILSELDRRGAFRQGLHPISG